MVSAVSNSRESQKPSSTSRNELLWVAIAFTLVFVALLPGAFSTIGVPDEGFAVYNAKRILDGDVIYRDFLAVYSPGNFLTYAGLFRIFGQALAVERVYPFQRQRFTGHQLLS